MAARRSRKVAAIVAGIFVVVLALVAGWWFWLGSGDAADGFEASESLSGDSSDATGPDSGAMVDEAPGADQVDLDGTWSVALDEVEDSGAGYRILEDLPVGGPEEITGRTQAVTGSIDISGSTLDSAELSVDMTDLDSGNELRDDIVGGRYLQTGQFPTATLVVSDSTGLELPAEPGVLAPFSIPADLTVHGVKQPVTVEGQGQWGEQGSRVVIEIVGLVDTTLAAFGVERPDLVGRTAREEVVIEFKLQFAPSP